MARGKFVKAECDICGFAYRRTLMKKNSYGLWVCPDDWDGAYDRVNHFQNKVPDMRDNSNFVMNARPEPNYDRNIKWEDATQVHTTIYQWDTLDKYWNTV